MIIIYFKNMDGMKFAIHILACFSCMNIVAATIERPKVDFSQLEFENLDTEATREEFVKNLESYEVSYPVAIELENRLDDNQTRSRRDLREKKLTSYRILAFGKILEVELQRSDSILPGASIEYHKSDGIQHKLLSDNECFKIGKVTNSNGSSSVALSDCNGLAGLVKTDDDLIFIEPMRVKSDANRPSTQRPHLVYRTKDLPASLPRDYNGRFSMGEALQAPSPFTNMSASNRSSRMRRDVWDSFITVVNKARRSIQLHWLDLFGQRRYFVTLRPNQRRDINTYANTKWVAIDDSTQKVMLMNKKNQFIAKRNSDSNRVTITITAPAGFRNKQITSNKLMGEDHWIEALVVADESIVAFHGKEKVEKYLLVLSNMISLIMKDPSIGVRLNFVLTRLVILQRQEPKLRIYKKNPSKSVHSACDYAASLQKSQDDTHEGHHDFALILTKHKFGPAGYAPVYTMCTRTRSCALVDDSGFASAFIAAHEAGHTLGLGHDGDENDCRSDTQKGSVMAPLVISKLSQFHWSRCSRKTIQENIGYFNCLKDRPSPTKYKYLDTLPGVYTTMDEQCKFVFGRGHERCEYYSARSCQRLWCTETSGRYFSCTTRRRPPLDGTFCGPDKWCRKGSCVPSDVPSTRPTPIDGKWGQWGSWSTCSQSCGIGVRYRSRKCDNPKPANRGKDCQGKSSDREICNSQKCDIVKHFHDIRNEQCKIFAGRDWSLYTNQMFQKLLKSRKHTLDCTFQHGLCNWQQDRNDNFDWIFNNGRTPSAETGPKNDHNGNSNGKYMYIEASDNLRQRRRKGDTARLISPEAAVPMACMKFYYHMYGTHMGSLKIFLEHQDGDLEPLWQKNGNQGNLWYRAEVSIQSSKPYKIIIEAIRGAHYTSDVSIDSLVFNAGLCEKETEVKNPCSLSCTSSDKRQFLLDKTVLDGTRCYNNKSHDICLKGKCEVYGCDNKFGSTKILDDCNVCGGDGSTCNAVEGTKEVAPKKEYEKIMDIERGTTNFVLEENKPSPYKIGLRVPGSVRYTYMPGKADHGYYSIAGATLYHTRLEDKRQMISSVGPFNQDLEAVIFSGNVDINKRKEKVELRYKYFEKKRARDVYKYEVKKWGRCSKSCDLGTQSAVLKCVKNKRKEVPLKYCSHLRKNELVRSCNTASCKDLYKWIILPWSRCSAKCGSGRQRRVVACVLRKQNKVVRNSECPPPYPENWRYCNTQPCVTYSWRVSDWGTCSKSCGGGLQVRSATCVEDGSKRQAFSRMCKSKIPEKTRECNLQECDSFRHKTAAVGKCSKSCGGGLRVKIIYCINERTGGRVANSFCTGPPPPRIEKCSSNPCPQYEWMTGQFGACSQTCDGGERRRDVYCLEKRSQRRASENSCTDPKPRSTETCDNPPCSNYFWDAGSWSSCDSFCGSGLQNRSVKCLMEGTRSISPESRCSLTVQKPKSLRSCRIRDCASPDSLTCNFDNHHFCNWKNVQGDNFDWILGKKTPTLTTGPNKDHTNGRGEFAYIETSSPRLSRDRAVLSSPAVNMKRGCLSFWYHMKGSGMGRLLVFLINESNYKKQVLLRERHQGDRWKKANIAIPKDTPKGYKIIIIGQKGTSFLSDIAIDDIEYTEDDCPASCIERSPLCVVVPMEQYCQFPPFKKLCCETCSRVL